jgi:hypothetical protein
MLFLDLSIARRGNNFQLKIYLKPTMTYAITPADSCHTSNTRSVPSDNYIIAMGCILLHKNKHENITKSPNIPCKQINIRWAG